jgi:hypothetical protein
LAEGVRELRRREGDHRGVHDPVALPVRWCLAAGELTGHWAGIARVPAGATAEPPAVKVGTGVAGAGQAGDGAGDAAAVGTGEGSGPVAIPDATESATTVWRGTHVPWGGDWHSTVPAGTLYVG